MYKVQIPNLPRSVGLSANGFLYSGGSGGVKKARPGGAYEGTAPPAPNPARIDAPWCAGGLQSRNSKCETLCYFCSTGTFYNNDLVSGILFNKIWERILFCMLFYVNKERIRNGLRRRNPSLFLFIFFIVTLVIK